MSASNGATHHIFIEYKYKAPMNIEKNLRTPLNLSGVLRFLHFFCLYQIHLMTMDSAKVERRLLYSIKMLSISSSFLSNFVCNSLIPSNLDFNCAIILLYLWIFEHNFQTTCQNPWNSFSDN